MEIEIIPVPDDKELSAALDSAVKWIAESLTARSCPKSHLN